jgi:hypothetical protein
MWIEADLCLGLVCCGSGYHAPLGLVAAVLRAVGVRLEDLTAEVAAAGVSRHNILVAAAGAAGAAVVFQRTAG